MRTFNRILNGSWMSLLAMTSLVACSGSTTEESPTPWPETPTEAPGTPTMAPATPTMAPATPTEEPATPTMAPATPTMAPATPTPTADQRVYQAAVDDASLPEASEIYDGLVRIAEDNPELLWLDGRVKMVTWTGWNGYDGLVGQDTTLTREVWVTAFPFVQNFCLESGLTDEALSLRLEQLLGLPPGNGKTRFVSLWVNNEDMFRPCKDAEITDTVCGLEFPEGTDSVHMDWINNLAASSYGEGGYPWTQLGYTYDWYEDETEVGPSEFVIRAGSTVGVEAVDMNADYCTKLAQ